MGIKTMKHSLDSYLLPYGKWTTAAGTEFLFNRHYVPFMIRKDGEVSRCESMFIPYEKTTYFYNDSRASRDMNRARKELVQWIEQMPGNPLGNYADFSNRYKE